jgi:hypothetical protein
MKTTIELSEALFLAAKRRAKAQDTTLRSLVEEGLRTVLSRPDPAEGSAFVLKDARVHGQAMLMPDRRDWHALEDEHLRTRSGLRDG